MNCGPVETLEDLTNPDVSFYESESQNHSAGQQEASCDRMAQSTAISCVN